MQLWLWDRSRPKPLQLTSLAGGINPDIGTRFPPGTSADVARVAWSPDGKFIAFASRVALPNMSYSPAAPLVLHKTSPAGLTLSGVCKLPWVCSADTQLHGREWVNAVADPAVRLVSQILVVHRGSGTVTKASGPNEIAFSPAWKGPTTLIFSSIEVQEDLTSLQDAYRHDHVAVRILEVDLLSHVTKVAVSTPGIARRLHVAQDGFTLYFLTSRSLLDPPRLAVADLRDGNIQYPKIPGEIEELHPIGASMGVSYVVDHLRYLRTLKGPDPHDQSTRRLEASFNSWDVDRSGAIVWIDAEGAVHKLPAAASRSRKVFAFRKAVSWGKTEVIEWQNGVGDKLSGQVLYPPDYVPGRRYPLIVDVYPLMSRSTWRNPMHGNETWAAAGYIVFQPGPRGPHVWMNADTPFAAAGKGPAGWTLALDDLMTGIESLNQRKIIDPDRMCLYGWSNGGAEASYLVTMTDRFKCVVVVAPGIVNWMAFTATTGGRKLTKTLSGGWDLDRNGVDLIQMSAVYNLRKSATPMLLFCGDEDTFLPSAVEVYNAVRESPADITFVRYPGQGHAFTGAALEDFWSRQMRFFAQHLRATHALAN